MSEKKIPLNCRIPLDMKLALEKQGQARGLTLTDVVVEALNAMLVNNNGEAATTAPPKEGFLFSSSSLNSNCSIR